MRYLVLAANAAALLALSACGSTTADDEQLPTIGSPATASVTEPVESVETQAPEQAPERAPANAVRSTIADVTAYAPALEQVFFNNGYPEDLAGALKTANKLSNLSLLRGNSIASYRYDAMEREFTLCVENTSGAYAIYDTSPMTTVDSGKSGGCP